MSDPEATKRIRDLRDEINHHTHLYHVLDSPIISDSQYDSLIRELRDLEEAHPELLTADSPTQLIGAVATESFAGVDHPIPLLSLANAFDEEGMKIWHRRAQNLLDDASFDMVSELKIDGLAVALTYEEGKLVRGATRGNGHHGEDVTQNLRTIKSIPHIITDPGYPKLLEVRGEVYIPKSSFQLLNEERTHQGEAPYANPRNIAAGSLRQLDPSVTASRPLDIFIYSLGYAEGGAMPDNHWDTLQQLQIFGFKINPNNVLCTGLADVRNYIRIWLEKKEELDYGVDGLVVKINPYGFQQHLGSVGREPRWAIAYKFPATQEITKLKRIGLSIGRTGTINPYAELEPVNIGGATIKMATLHNEEDIRRKDIRVGDWVIVERAGEVIPHIVGPVTTRRTGEEQVFTIPTSCPVCNSGIVRAEGEAFSYCTNTVCPAQFARLLMHFVSRDCMDIEGLGEKLAMTLIDAGLVNDLGDIYAITNNQLINLEHMAQKSAGNIMESIRRSKGRPLHNTLMALGIRHVGLETAELLTNRLGSIDRLAETTEDELKTIPNVGPKISQSIVAYFRQQANRRVIAKLKAAGIRMETTNSHLNEKHGIFSGLQFVITGRLSSMSRSQTEAKIKELSGSVSSNVSRKTSYLIVGEDPGSKLNEAEQLETPRLNEVAFLRFLEEKPTNPTPKSGQ
jgi:DNA ligase (NAD+)